MEKSIINMACDLALYFKEKEGEIGRNPHYNKMRKELLDTIKDQPSGKLEQITLRAQRLVVMGELPAGTIYYLNKRWVTRTKLFRNIYQSLSEYERKEYGVTEKVNPKNGARMIEALEHKLNELKVEMEKSIKIMSNGKGKKNSITKKMKKIPKQKKAVLLEKNPGNPKASKKSFVDAYVHNSAFQCL